MTEKIKIEYIEEKFSRLKMQESKLFASSNSLIQKKIEIENARNNLVMEGKIVGKNVAERDASAKQLLSILYAKLEAMEEDLIARKHDLKIAQINIDEIKVLLRALELQNG